MRPTFLFIDLLNDFFREPPLADVRASLVASVNELSAFARDNSFPVVWVRQEFEPDLSDAFLSMKDDNRSITIKGTDGCKVLSDLDRKPEDHEIIKKRYSAFFQTNLDDLLKTFKFSHLVFGGVNSHACVRAAVVDAYQRDHRIVVASNCVSSYDENYHSETMRYLENCVGDVLDNSTIMKACHAV